MKKRSKYKPKPIRYDVMQWVINGFQPMRENPATVDLRIKNHAAMTAIVKGVATKDDVDVMIAAFNVTEALARSGIGKDWSQEIAQAQDALFQMARRGATKGRFVCTGPEMNALNLGMDVHDAQLESCTVTELEKALEIVQKTIRNKQARFIVETT